MQPVAGQPRRDAVALRRQLRRLQVRREQPELEACRPTAPAALALCRSTQRSASAVALVAQLLELGAARRARRASCRARAGPPWRRGSPSTLLWRPAACASIPPWRRSFASSSRLRGVGRVSIDGAMRVGGATDGRDAEARTPCGWFRAARPRHRLGHARPARRRRRRRQRQRRSRRGGEPSFAWCASARGLARATCLPSSERARRTRLRRRHAAVRRDAPRAPPSSRLRLRARSLARPAFLGARAPRPAAPRTTGRGTIGAARRPGVPHESRTRLSASDVASAPTCSPLPSRRRAPRPPPPVRPPAREGWPRTARARVGEGERVRDEQHAVPATERGAAARRAETPKERSARASADAAEMTDVRRTRRGGRRGAHRRRRRRAAARRNCAIREGEDPLPPDRARRLSRLRRCPTAPPLLAATPTSWQERTAAPRASSASALAACAPPVAAASAAPARAAFALLASASRRAVAASCLAVAASAAAFSASARLDATSSLCLHLGSQPARSPPPASLPRRAPRPRHEAERAAAAVAVSAAHARATGRGWRSGGCAGAARSPRWRRSAEVSSLISHFRAPRFDPQTASRRRASPRPAAARRRSRVRRVWRGGVCGACATRRRRRPAAARGRRSDGGPRGSLASKCCAAARMRAPAPVDGAPLVAAAARRAARSLPAGVRLLPAARPRRRSPLRTIVQIAGRPSRS